MSSSSPQKPGLELVGTAGSPSPVKSNPKGSTVAIRTNSNNNNNNNNNLISIDNAIEQIGMGAFQFRILLAAGLCFAADSMEVLLLSFLAVVLQAQWGLSEEQTSTMTSVVFLGAVVGTLVLGWLGDRIGRKPVFWLTALLICVFGFATAATDTYLTLVICRFLVGFGVGGLTVPFDTLAEFVPDSARGSNLLLIEYFWTAGTILVPVVAIFTLGRSDNEEEHNNEWRYFVLVCGVPCLISSIVAVVYVPESPRWLMTQGKNEEALTVLREAARINGHDGLSMFPPETKLYEDHVESENFCDLFKPQWRTMTIFLWLTWAGFAFAYYGTIMAVTLVFASGEDLEREGMYSFDYSAILICASSEIAGTTLVLLLVDRVGRIPSQVFCYTAGGISLFALCLMATREDVGDGVEQKVSRAWLIFMAFMARCFMMGGASTTWVSTAELLTTEIRTTGHSSANALARLSGAMSPYLVASDKPFALVGGVILAVSLGTAASSSRLPETKGKRLGLHPEDLPKYRHCKVAAAGAEETKVAIQYGVLG